MAIMAIKLVIVTTQLPIENMSYSFVQTYSENHNLY